MTEQHTERQHGTTGNCARVVMDAELTIYQAADTHARLLATLADSEALEIDLSGVEEIDSAGVQVLIHLKESARHEARTLRLVGHSRPVIEVLELVKLESFFGDPLVLPASDPTASRGDGR
ncbi:MAG: STAS domain-containing protein [Rhodocyclaceae bacterium]|nr:STAS domain-containing protein [Rhodocyclaceae bacterium]